MNGLPIKSIVEQGIKMTHVGRFLVMWAGSMNCYVWPNMHWKMHESTVKTCNDVSSRDKKKKQAGSYFVMRAGLRNNEFCLCGLIFVK